MSHVLAVQRATVADVRRPDLHRQRLPQHQDPMLAWLLNSTRRMRLEVAARGTLVAGIARAGAWRHARRGTPARALVVKLAFALALALVAAGCATEARPAHGAAAHLPRSYSFLEILIDHERALELEPEQVRQLWVLAGALQDKNDPIYARLREMNRAQERPPQLDASNPPTPGGPRGSRGGGRPGGGMGGPPGGGGMGGPPGRGMGGPPGGGGMGGPPGGGRPASPPGAAPPRRRAGGSEQARLLRKLAGNEAAALADGLTLLNPTQCRRGTPLLQARAQELALPLPSCQPPGHKLQRPPPPVR